MPAVQKAYSVFCLLVKTICRQGLTFEPGQTIGYEPNHLPSVGLEGLVADGEGMVYAAFRGRPDDVSPHEVFVQASSDYGVTWSSPTVVQTFSRLTATRVGT